MRADVVIVDDYGPVHTDAWMNEAYGVQRQGEYTPWQKAVDDAAFKELTKVPAQPRVTKLQKRLTSMREFFRGMTAFQLEESQRIYNAFIRPRFNWSRPVNRNSVSQAKREAGSRQLN